MEFGTCFIKSPLTLSVCFLGCLLSLNVNSTIEGNGTHLLAMLQSQKFGVNSPNAFPQPKHKLEL